MSEMDTTDGGIVTLLLYSTHPPRIESNCLLPVEMRTTFFRWWNSSMAVMKPDADGWDISCHGKAQFISFFQGQTSKTDQTFLYCLLYFLYLDLTESLDFQQCSACSAMDRLDHSQLSATGFSERLRFISSQQQYKTHWLSVW